MSTNPSVPCLPSGLREFSIEFWMWQMQLINKSLPAGVIFDGGADQPHFGKLPCRPMPQSGIYCIHSGQLSGVAPPARVQGPDSM
jgi:hypothetical protein